MQLIEDVRAPEWPQALARTEDRAQRAVRVAPNWARGFEDLPVEHAFDPIAVEGRLPHDLEGTLYLAGPGSFDTLGQRAGCWLDADGAVTAVRLGGGGAQAAARLVETPDLARERSAGRALFGGLGTRSPRPMREHLFGETKARANAGVVAWQNRIFALAPGAAPIELGKDALDAIGALDLGEPAALGAHVKRIGGRGAQYGFSMKAGHKPALEAWELPARGPARKIASVDLDRPAFVHDFAVTSRHLVFFLPPVRPRPLRTALGGTLGDGMGWSRRAGTEVVVIPLDEGRPYRFTVDSFFAWHVVNAYERCGEIVVDLVRHRDFAASHRFLGGLASGTASANGAKLTRLVLDPKRRRGTFDELWDAPCELPAVSPLVGGWHYRYAYVLAHSDASGGAFFDRLAKVDVWTGESTDVVLGPHRFPTHPVFVPRATGIAPIPVRGGITTSPSALGREDDGWLLTMAYDAASHVSEVLVFDARAPGDAVARVRLGHHVPFALHATWVAA